MLNFVKLFFYPTLFIFSSFGFGQTFVVDFDDDANWTLSGAGYQNDHEYNDQNWLFTGGPALRNGIGAQDGFPGALGTYSWRLRNNTSVVWMATFSAAADISEIGFDVRRWDDSPSPDFLVEYSSNSGGTWVTIATINNAFLGNSSDWITLNHTLASITSVTAGDFIVRVSALGTTERIMIDNFTWTESSSSNTINTSNVSPLIFEVDCTTDDTGTVDFTSVGAFNGGNVFTAQLSDGLGNFATPINIGSLSLDGTDPSGTIPITIPAGTPNGTGYRIRVISDDPNTVGSDNGTDIEIVYTPCPTPLPASGGLLINEFSNGSSGQQEFYEFIVAGQCGETIDVRNYIIDDNNGTFSNPIDYPAGTGIAEGHLRLTNHPQWANIAVGSIIVVYNASDPNSNLPADDPFDSDNDSLFVIPHNNTTLFEIETSIPNASDPDSTYAPSTYTGTGWNALGLANSGDAVQVRQPDGSYFHGVSYGGTEITGGPDGTKIFNGGLSGANGYFNSGDFTDPVNWSIGSAPTDETPGTYNNTLNEEWLRLMRDPDASTCPVDALPVTLVLFDGEYENDEVKLHWESSTEQNNNYYQLFHSTDGYNFNSIGTVPGAGSVNHSIHYDFKHRGFLNGINYYKLHSVDFDGTVHYKGLIAVSVELNEVYYDAVSSSILLPSKESYSIYSTSGQLVMTAEGESSVPFNKKGVFLVINNQRQTSTKIIIQ